MLTLTLVKRAPAATQISVSTEFLAGQRLQSPSRRTREGFFSSGQRQRPARLDVEGVGLRASAGSRCSQQGAREAIIAPLSVQNAGRGK